MRDAVDIDIVLSSSLNHVTNLLFIGALFQSKPALIKMYRMQFVFLFIVMVYNVIITVHLRNSATNNSLGALPIILQLTV